MQGKLLLIDGHSILSRAFYGIPMLTSSRGIHTNAVYGFLNILFKVIDEEQADHLAVAFDLSRHTFRTELFSGYKGTRKEMPEELREQVPIIQEILKAMNIPILTMEQYEADDILGTIAKRSQKEGISVTVLSGDRDLLQLADEDIKISIPKTSKGRTEVFQYYPEDVKAEWGVTPLEFIDMKGLMGDSSDNIPGVPSIGEKTARTIIQQFHSIENAYAHIDEVPKRAQKALAEHYDMAQLSKKLATIITEVPIDFTYEQAAVADMYNEKALELMKQYEFKTIAARFSAKMEEKGASKAQEEKLPSPKLVTDPFLGAVALKDALLEKALGFFLLSEKERTAFALCLSRDRLYVFRSSEDYPADRLLQDAGELLSEAARRGLASRTPHPTEHLHTLPLRRSSRILDLSIAAYLLNPLKDSYDQEDIARDYLGLQVPGAGELIGKNDLLKALFGEATEKKKARKEDTAEGPGERETALSEHAASLLAQLAYIPLMAKKELLRQLKDKGMERLFKEVEMPLCYSLSDMEREGIRVDENALSEYAELLKKQIDAVEAEIFAETGERFNLNSPQQLGTVLFEKLGMKGGKKTKTGYSTAADVLQKLAPEYPVVEKILRYRALSKLYSTYAVGLSAFISGDGRIHGTFNQTITATGRISSTDPNLQNIPVRTEEGKELRKVFIPAEGHTFVDADYSQVELRILAALSGDEKLINAYRDAVDIHALTASEVFHVPLSDVTPEMRRNAKAVNFGIVYGISAYGLGEGLSISQKEAKGYINKYFETYPGVKNFLDDQVAHAKENGFVRTFFGRIRPIPELSSSNFMQRSFGERVAMNSPIQGTAADIMKIAMNRVNMALSGLTPEGERIREPMKSHIVLQVHDELLIETAPEELAEVKAMVKKLMEEAAELSVKLAVDVQSGDNWYDCH